MMAVPRLLSATPQLVFRVSGPRGLPKPNTQYVGIYAVDPGSRREYELLESSRRMKYQAYY